MINNFHFYSFNAFKGFVTGLSMPIWVFHLTNNGISLLQIGVLGTILEIFRLVMEVPSGSFSDKCGEKTSIFLSVVSGACCWLLFYLFDPSFVSMTVAMFFLAASGSLSSGAFESWISKTNPHSGFVHILSRSNQFLYAFFVLGTLISGHIYASYSAGVFLVAAIALMVSAIPILLKPGPARGGGEEEGDSFLGTIKNGLKIVYRSKIIVIVMASTFFVNMSYDTFERYWQPFLQEKNFTIESFGYLLSLTGVIALFGFEFIKRVQSEHTLVLMIVVEIISIVLILSILNGSGTLIFVATATLLAIGRIRTTYEQIFLNEHLPGRYKSTLFSLVAGAGALGEIFAGVLLGLVMQYLSMTFGFLLCGVFILLSFLLLQYFLLIRNRVSPQRDF